MKDFRLFRNNLYVHIVFKYLTIIHLTTTKVKEDK